MSLFTCQYVADGRTQTTIFNDSQVLGVMSLKSPAAVLHLSGSQKTSPAIKSWLKIKGCNDPFGITETKQEFCQRTGIDPDSFIEFQHIANGEVRSDEIRAKNILAITRPTADEVANRMAMPPTEVPSDPRVKAFLFHDGGAFPIMIYRLTEEPAVIAVAKRAGIPLAL